IVSINVSKGGVPKLPIAMAQVGKLGIEGDKQKDKRYHGGPERAICLFCIEEIMLLQEAGHPIFVGSTGENLTLSTAHYALLQPGVRLSIGLEVELEITSFAAPCKTIRHSFLNDEFKLMSVKLFPTRSRLYAKVIRDGSIYVDDQVLLLTSD
ncbi:MAG: hypothetical protein KA198_01765, partial [Chitinophagaceae bacterium]|nr:hypothetical protein [Chitinophagaceae bacterium]